MSRRCKQSRKFLEGEYLAAVASAGSKDMDASQEVTVDFPQNLVDIFTHGLMLDQWVWSSYDKDFHCLWESERHEADVQLARHICKHVCLGLPLPLPVPLMP